MFDLKPETLAFFDAQQAERVEGGYPVTLMGPEGFAKIEALWGHPLPEAFKVFMSTYGDVAFPDEGQAETMYVYKEGDFEQQFACTFGGFLALDAVLSAHQHMIADPDNETETPFFPPNMMPFGSDPGTNVFLLELGTATPAIWFWEDQYGAFGEGDNTRLGLIAPDLTAFIAGLS